MFVSVPQFGPRPFPQDKRFASGLTPELGAYVIRRLIASEYHSHDLV